MAEKKENKGNVTFADIKAMYEGGMMGLTSRTLDIAHAYKVSSFKTKLKNAYQEMDSRRLQLVKDAGIEDGNAHDKRLRELSVNKQRTEAEELEFKELVAKNEAFKGLYEQLLQDRYEIEPKTMPFGEWMKLQEANKDIKFGNCEVLAQFETLLEGILWAAPEEK